MPDINIGAITEALNDKEDRDLRNTDTGLGADAVIEFQIPTADNNYTWYRKYASGWVEQGGVSTSAGVTFPITMADVNYFCSCLPKVYSGDAGSIDAQYINKATTGCEFVLRWKGAYAGINESCERLWEIKGMSAS